MEYQVENNPNLLNQMMADLQEGPELYRPTNYWSYYEKWFLPELKKKGLVNFRSRRNSVLGSFGATDLLSRPSLRVNRSFRGARYLNTLCQLLIEKCRFLKFGISADHADDVTEYFYHLVKEKFARLDLDLAHFPSSSYGNPEDQLYIEDGLWTTAHLQMCSIFADAYKWLIPLEAPILCEIGAGLGRNAEIFGKLSEKSTILIFDIPPQLYVSHQYLKKVFPGRVIEYESAVKLKLAKSQIPDSLRGKIVMLPTWCLPKWNHIKIDLFWNSASFQEMEPKVVINYMENILTMNPEWVYINALPDGNYWGQQKSGFGGTLSPVRKNLYEEILIKKFDLVAQYPTDYFLRRRDYVSLVFRTGNKW